MDKKQQLITLGKKLKSHDWYYSRTDDPRVRKSGTREWEELVNLVSSLESIGAGKESEKLWVKFAPKDYVSQYPKPNKPGRKQPKYKFDNKGNVTHVWDTYDANWDNSDTLLSVANRLYFKDKKTGYWVSQHYNDILNKKIVGKHLYEIKYRIYKKILGELKKNEI